jgi:hypothetical protein
MTIEDLKKSYVKYFAVGNGQAAKWALLTNLVGQWLKGGRQPVAYKDLYLDKTRQSDSIRLKSLEEGGFLRVAQDQKTAGRQKYAEPTDAGFKMIEYINAYVLRKSNE